MSLSRTLTSAAIAVVLVWLLLAWSGVSPGEVLTRTLELRPAALAVSTLVLAGIYGARALRFKLLLPAGTSSLTRLLPVTGAHGMMAYFLPAKLGEASLIVYLRSAARVPGATGLAVLLVARVLDLASVAGSLGLACVLLGLGDAYPDLPWMLPLGAGLLALTAVLAIASLESARLVRLVALALTPFGLARTQLGTRLRAAAEKVAEALGEVRGRRLLAGAIASPPIWIGVYLYYGILARALGLDGLDGLETIFGASLAVLANLLPINGFAGFGTQDGGWVAGFCALGAPRDVATSSALAFHLVYIAHICLFGVLGQALLSGRRSSEEPRTDVDSRPPDEHP